MSSRNKPIGEVKAENGTPLGSEKVRGYTCRCGIDLRREGIHRINKS